MLSRLFLTFVMKNFEAGVSSCFWDVVLWYEHMLHSVVTHSLLHTHSTIRWRSFTSLQQKRVYTSLGSSCPTCVHQSWENAVLFEQRCKHDTVINKAPSANCTVSVIIVSALIMLFCLTPRIPMYICHYLTHQKGVHQLRYFLSLMRTPHLSRQLMLFCLYGF